jgi:hypothetical protein
MIDSENSEGDMGDEETAEDRSRIRSATVNEKIEKPASIESVTARRNLLLCHDAYPTNRVSFEMDIVVR